MPVSQAFDIVLPEYGRAYFVGAYPGIAEYQALVLGVLHRRECHISLLQRMLKRNACLWAATARAESVYRHDSNPDKAIV